MMRNLLGKGVTEVELDEELNAYVAALAAEKTGRGLSAEAARRSAMLEVGGMEVVKEQVREARSGYYVGAFMTDIRYTMRMLVKHPGYTLAIVITLADHTRVAIESVA